MNDSTQSIFHSAKRFFSGTMLSRITGMLRDMSMAFAFGTQPSIAAFMVAFRLAHLLRRLLGEGALQSVFIPEFEEMRRENPQKAFLFFRNLVFALTLLLLVLITLGVLVIGVIIAFGNLHESNQEVLWLTLLMLPSLLFICLFGLNASLLQCEKSFFTPGVAPVAFNVIWIVAIYLIHQMTAAAAMPYLAVGIIVACFCQWLITVPSTLRILRQNFDCSLWKNISLQFDPLKKISKPLFLGITGVAAMQVNNAIDALFARYAEAEGPALLWYSMRIQQLPLALFGIALGSALLPPLSRAIKAHDWSQYSHFLGYAFKQTLTLIVPMTFFIFVMGDTCVNVLYGRGDFTNASILGTSRCLWAYGLGLLPAALVMILAPASYAQSNYRLPAIAAFLTMAINCIFNAVVIIGFGLGAMSVALATSFSCWVNLIYLGKSLPGNATVLSIDFWKHVRKVCLATLIASAGVICLRALVGDLNLWQMLWNESVNFPKKLVTQLSLLCAEGSLFWLLYAGMALNLNIVNWPSRKRKSVDALKS